MATHAPITGAPMRAPLLPRFALLNRAEIEQEVERLIAILDTADGDCDLEDDDPAGDPLDAGEGEGDHGRGLFKTLPTYGLDQSRGPTNEREAERTHMAEVYGLVRSSTGRWRHPS